MSLCHSVSSPTLQASTAGGTGGGAAHVVADLAKQQGAVTISVAIQPAEQQQQQQAHQHRKVCDMQQGSTRAENRQSLLALQRDVLISVCVQHVNVVLLLHCYALFCCCRHLAACQQTARCQWARSSCALAAKRLMVCCPTCRYHAVCRALQACFRCVTQGCECVCTCTSGRAACRLSAGTPQPSWYSKYISTVLHIRSLCSHCGHLACLLVFAGVVVVIAAGL